jgi:starch synthase (maltosyl-transferring)
MSAPAGPRIFNLFPLLAGTVDDWRGQLPRIAGMGFDWVFVNPFHLTGGSRSLYAVADYYQLDPRFKPDGDSQERLLRRFLQEAEDQGLSVMLDLVINHTAKDSRLVTEHPEWYTRDADGQVRSPFAVDPADESNVTVWGDLAEIDYSERPERAAIVAYWERLIGYYVGLGFHGFRCDAAYKVPGEVWGELITTGREMSPAARFFAETLGAQGAEIEQLRSAGFDYIFNSAKWWDFREPWLLEQYEQFRHLAPSIAFPETHDTTRLAEDRGGDERASRLWYLFAACFSTGVMMPLGYEYGFRRQLHVVETTPEDWEEPAFDLSDFVAAVNRMKAATPVLNQEGPQERVSAPDEGLVGLVRRADDGPERTALLLNPDPDQARTWPAGMLAEVLERPPGEIHEITPEHEPADLSGGGGIELGPREARVFATGSEAGS